MEVIVNKFLKIIVLALIIFAPIGAVDYNTRIGVMNLFTNLDGIEAATLSKKSVNLIKKRYHELGGYDVFTQDRMEESYETFSKNFPDYCHEPRCVSVIGSALELDRVLYGSVVKNGSHYAIMFTLVDVASKDIIDSCSIEGDDNASLKDVIDGGIAIINSSKDDDLASSLNRYYGEEVDNKKAMLISSGSVIAAGLFMAFIGTDYQNDKIDFTDKLSGIDPLMSAIPQSARAKAMGNSYVAASKDAYGAFFNPAGAVWVDGPDMAISFQNRFGAVNSFSGAFINKATKKLAWGHTVEYSGSPDSYLMELYLSTLASYKFNNLWGFMPPMSMGARFKINSIRITGTDGSDYSQKGTGYGFGLDLGFLLELSKQIDFGMVFTNLPSINIFNNESGGYRYVEPSPMALKLGGVFRVHYNTMLIAEGTIPLYADQSWRLAGGVEQKLFSYVRLRAGAEKTIFHSYDSPWHLTTGLGIDVPVKEKHIAVDASYEINTDLIMTNTWDVSIRVGL